MLAGKDKPASCVLVGSGVNLMPFAGRVSHLGKTVNGNVGDPLTLTLADEPVATVFGVGTDISNADPHIRAAAMSASSMWAANAATVSPAGS